MELADDLAEELGCEARHVQGPDDLRPHWFEGCRAVGLTAGTSTLDETVDAVVEAITEQVKKGTAYAVGTVQEVEYAEHLLSRNPNFERIRFANSGTEAVMACLKASRAYTGRPKIAKVEGAYHGLYDYAEVSQTANPSNWGDANSPASVPVAYGTPESALRDVIVIPFNQPEQALEIFRPPHNIFPGVKNIADVQGFTCFRHDLHQTLGPFFRHRPGIETRLRFNDGFEQGK